MEGMNKANPLVEKEIEEYLKKGISQRQIAKMIKLSLQTVNKYCQRIKNKVRAEENENKERKRTIKERIIKAKEIEIKSDEPISEERITENTMRVFNDLLVEIRARIPTMSNSELRQTTIDIWEKIK